jgi:N-terminal acetyltransferase B complex catalytic subunit
MGKVEGDKDIKDKMPWHGHVTAVTVSPEYRRIGVAKNLMDLTELISEKVHNAFFVDLFVRESNSIAVNMYKRYYYK